MGNKVLNYINWGILIVVTLLAVWFVWAPAGGGYVDLGSENDSKEAVCVDVGTKEKFSYEACFDAYQETIFLKAERAEENYNVDGLSVFFVDLSSKAFDLDEVPGMGESRAYKISAQKNPSTIDLRLDVRGVPEGVCGPRTILVDYCPAGTGGGSGGGLISPIEGIGANEFIEVEDLPDFESDFIVMDLAEKEAVWEAVCKSDWDCGEWEACDNGISRRKCVDLKNCLVPTGSPISAKKCDGSCMENWECEWGTCEDGVSVPSCRDLNGCGTKYQLPEKLACEESGTCSPEVFCGEWSDCEVDYDFLDLVGSEGVADLEGSKSRLCTDKKGCVLPKKEEVACSVSVDVYTKRFERCGASHVGVYNVLDDSTLAILRKDNEESYLNIYFDDQDGVYCDYCFDGKRNGDEEGIDCGGSCRDCSVARVASKRWWERFF